MLSCPFNLSCLRDQSPRWVGVTSIHFSTRDLPSQKIAEVDKPPSDPRSETNRPNDSIVIFWVCWFFSDPNLSRRRNFGPTPTPNFFSGRRRTFSVFPFKLTCLKLFSRSIGVTSRQRSRSSTSVNLSQMASTSSLV